MRAEFVIDEEESLLNRVATPKPKSASEREREIIERAHRAQEGELRKWDKARRKALKKAKGEMDALSGGKPEFI